MGLSLSRATMSNWLMAVYRDRLSHVVGHLRQELLKQEYLHIDEPHVQVLMEPGRKNTSDSYMWVYCSIRDYTDAYSGYNGVKGVTRCLCYTHLRRAFVDALPKISMDRKLQNPRKQSCG